MAPFKPKVCWPFPTSASSNLPRKFSSKTYFTAKTQRRQKLISPQRRGDAEKGKNLFHRKGAETQRKAKTYFTAKAQRRREAKDFFHRKGAETQRKAKTYFTAKAQRRREAKDFFHRKGAEDLFFHFFLCVLTSLWFFFVFNGDDSK
jgi:hypothetical protein